jgi:acylphosphatase
MLKRFHIFASGKVQGVFYRDFARKCAMVLGVKGWVRNTEDGRVEIMAEGTERSLRELVSKLKVGPEMARVDEVEAEEEDYRNEFSKFDVL